MSLGSTAASADDSAKVRPGRRGVFGRLLSVFRKKTSTSSPNKPAQPAHQKPRRFSESLEGRQMMSVTPLAFSPVAFYNAEAGSLAAADLTGNGKADIIAADGTNSIVHVLLNNGDGTFSDVQDLYVPGARSPVIADFNGDGIPDLAVLQPISGSNVPDGDTSAVDIFYGKGDGTFYTPPKVVGLSYYVNDMAAADLTNNGQQDLVISVAQRVIVLLNEGSKFAAPVPYNCGGGNSGNLAIGDFNGDGVPDIAIARTAAGNTGMDEVAVLIGQVGADGEPTGTFGKAELVRVGTNPRDIAVGDFSGNGKLDIVVANSDFREPALAVLPGNGNGTFGKPQYYYGGNFVDAVAVGDFAGDGINDIVTASFTSDVRVYAGNGDGTFQPPIDLPTDGFGESVVTADFTGNGRDDIAIATGGGIRVFLSEPQNTPTPTPTSTLTVTLGDGSPRSITYKDAQGPTATLNYTGPGSAAITFTGANLSLNSTDTVVENGTAQIQSISVSNATLASGLSISLSSRNGFVAVGAISVNSSIGSILAPHANLLGNLSIAGTARQLILNDPSNGTISVGQAGPGLTVNVGNATNESLSSATPISSLNVGQWVSTTSALGTITAPSIGSITSINAVSVNLQVGAGGLGSFFGRTILGGTWNVAGRVGNIFASRDVQVNLTAGAIGQLSSNNNLNNSTIVSDTNIGTIAAGSMLNSTIVAGGPLPDDERLASSLTEFTDQSGHIGLISLRERFFYSSFINSTISAPSIGPAHLGVVVFQNGGNVQGIATARLGLLDGADDVSKKLFSIPVPASLARLTSEGIDTADFVLRIL